MDGNQGLCLNWALNDYFELDLELQGHKLSLLNLILILLHLDPEVQAK